MTYVEKLQIEDDPDYDFLSNLLKKCMSENKIDPNQTNFTWNRLEEITPYIKLNLHN